MIYNRILVCPELLMSSKWKIFSSFKKVILAKNIYFRSNYAYHVDGGQASAQVHTRVLVRDQCESVKSTRKQEKEI